MVFQNFVVSNTIHPFKKIKNKNKIKTVGEDAFLVDKVQFFHGEGKPIVT